MFSMCPPPQSRRITYNAHFTEYISTLGNFCNDKNLGKVKTPYFPLLAGPRQEIVIFLKREPPKHFAFSLSLSLSLCYKLTFCSDVIYTLIQLRAFAGASSSFPIYFPRGLFFLFVLSFLSFWVRKREKEFHFSKGNVFSKMVLLPFS